MRNATLGARLERPPSPAVLSNRFVERGCGEGRERERDEELRSSSGISNFLLLKKQHRATKVKEGQRRNDQSRRDGLTLIDYLRFPGLFFFFDVGDVAPVGDGADDSSGGCSALTLKSVPDAAGAEDAGWALDDASS